MEHGDFREQEARNGSGLFHFLFCHAVKHSIKKLDDYGDIMLGGCAGAHTAEWFVCRCQGVTMEYVLTVLSLILMLMLQNVRNSNQCPCLSYKKPYKEIMQLRKGKKLQSELV